MAGDVVGMGDEVAGLDGLLAKAQMGNCEAAGLLGVVGEVGLGIEIGVVANDLDGLLVCTNGTVSAKAEELALDGALGHGVEFLLDVEAQVGHIVFDAHCEVVLGLAAEHVVVDSLDHAGGEVLGTKAVAAAGDLDVVAPAGFLEGCAHIEVEGLAEGAGFLGAIENSNLLGGGRQGLEQMSCGERTVQVHAHEAHAFAVGVHVLNGFVNDFTGRTHADDHALCIRGAIVFEEVMTTAGDAGHLLHVGFHNGGNRSMEGIACFHVLEVDVGVLGSATDVRMIRAHGVGAEFLDLVPGDDLPDVLVVDHLDLLDFVGGTESVEEVEHGDAGLDGGEVSHQGEVHAFLHGTGAQHGEAGLTAGHDVLMVAEDGQGVACDCTGGNMEDTGKKFAGDLVHVRDHQKKTLGCSVGGSQGASGEHTVNGTGSTSFRLHFTHCNSLAHQVLGPVGCHLVNDLAHDGRGSDGIDCSSIGEGICNPGGCIVAIHGFHLGHVILLKRDREYTIFQDFIAKTRLVFAKN